MAPNVGARPTRDLVMQALDRVVASHSFAGAGRQQRFRRFIVEKSFPAEGVELKEYVLALEVFDRPASFNLRTYSIVRVEARKLRESLERYYQAEGLLDPIRISLPKGGYTPVLESRLPGEAAPKLPSRSRRPWWLAAWRGRLLQTLQSKKCNLGKIELAQGGWSARCQGLGGHLCNPHFS